MSARNPDLPIVARAREHAARTAVVAPEGTFTYAELLDASARVAAALLAGGDDLREARVAFLAPPGWDYVAVQWGVWRAGGIAVPLAVSHPPAELEYVVQDADAEIVVAHPQFADVLAPIAERNGRRFLRTEDALAGEPVALPSIDEARRAMIVYTSGTTGKPKGAVTTHPSLRAQVAALVEAWGWTADDRILLVLPLHHVHGIVNVLACALWSGAVCEIVPRFDAGEVWEVIESGRLTLFMAVPTVYGRLIGAYDAADEERRERMSAGCRRMRLMVSGSAALPVQTLERWRQISGHVLLERYGMTEIGMALSNPLHGARRPGFVGVPLPGVRARLVDEDGAEVEPGTPGEIEIAGPAVFLEYWRRPEATAGAFRDGWFRTGDVAVVEDGSYRILGRRSVDIIKTGGYKVSALEIEEVLRTHPGILECAVVGVEDVDWGERVCAAVEARDGAALSLPELQAWARDHLAPYKLPRDLRTVDSLPRNAMGKVLKPEVAKLFL
ncbi:MAG TPA: acyl-CoA synthetase [Longimicrobium sp.]|jgi:malonyl-CoA/methylmalonyl-CoA synthetase|uniref:acyl-CoA synthetase n=1 Tax=Longimicrobium sp. TaxID=2029185 RepID=UPI002EDA1BFD